MESMTARHLNILIKPVSGNCNMRCKYCFYHSLSGKRSIESYGMMSEQTLTNLVKQALLFSTGSCTFAFQGGEPTLAGLDFFEKVIFLQKKYNQHQSMISNTIQTNGLELGQEWARFLARHNFLVGLSLDGPKEIHDANRIDTGGKGTYNRIMKTVAFFNQHHVQYNILSVITGRSARHGAKIYRFMRGKHFDYLQFIPCLDPFREKRGQCDYSLSPERLLEFLKTTFNLWYQDVIKGELVSIRYFDNLVRILLGLPPESCNQRGICTPQFVIEADGSVYPCDFYVVDEWKMGNINHDSIDYLAESNAALHFVTLSQPVHPACSDCSWYQLCRGGCRRDRENFESGQIDLNYYCAAYQAFFEVFYPKLKTLARFIHNKQNR